jgi:hypothetical protein
VTQLDRIEKAIHMLLKLHGAEIIQGEIIMSLQDDLKAVLDAASAQAAQNENIETAALDVLNTIQGQVAKLTAALQAAGIPPELIAQAQALTTGLAATAAPLAAAIAAIPPPV